MYRCAALHEEQLAQKLSTLTNRALALARHVASQSLLRCNARSRTEISGGRKKDWPWQRLDSSPPETEPYLAESKLAEGTKDKKCQPPNLNLIGSSSSVKINLLEKTATTPTAGLDYYSSDHTAPLDVPPAADVGEVQPQGPSKNRANWCIMRHWNAGPGWKPLLPSSTAFPAWASAFSWSCESFSVVWGWRLGRLGGRGRIFAS